MQIGSASTMASLTCKWVQCLLPLAACSPVKKREEKESLRREAWLIGGLE